MKGSIDYGSTKLSLAVFVVTSLILIMVTILTGMMCMRNFHKGSKAHIAQVNMPKLESNCGNAENGVILSDMETRFDIDDGDHEARVRFEPKEII